MQKQQEQLREFVKMLQQKDAIIEKLKSDLSKANMPTIKEITNEIHGISGVERTETMVEIQ